MVDVGDRVLVMPSFGENVAVPLGELSEGDKVILYNLKDDTRIAVPTLSLNVGDRVFSSPSFDFAGFDFNVPFDFNLIPLILNFIVAPSGTYWLDEIRSYNATYSPDYIANALGANDGTITYFGKDGWFIATFNIPAVSFIPNNGTITIWEQTGGVHQWSFTNLHDYTLSPWISPTTAATEYYEVLIQLPDKIKVTCRCTHNIGPGNIDAIRLVIP